MENNFVEQKTVETLEHQRENVLISMETMLKSDGKILTLL